MRVWAYEVLKNCAGLAPYVGAPGPTQRIFLSEGISKAPRDNKGAVQPYILYRFGNTSPDNRLHTARRQYLTVYCCDSAAPGDYLQIDSMLSEVVKAYAAAAPYPAEHILECRWLESSSDQDDREMGVILRYARFQIVRAQWEPGALIGE